MTALSWSVLVIGTALTLLVFSLVVNAMIGAPGFPGRAARCRACDS